MHTMQWEAMPWLWSSKRE
uniref:Uncharacterized protein n=1 Tax=Arundo donax TaxID=35708 RepID=A0A0A9FM30_ARUDO